MNARALAFLAALDTVRPKVVDHFVGLGGVKNKIGVTFARDVTMDELSHIAEQHHAKDFGRSSAMRNLSDYNGAWFQFR